VAQRLAQVARRAPEAIALHDVEKARAELVVKEAAVTVAEAQIALRKADLARGQALARYALLRAPWSGAVAKRHVHPGALLDAGTAVLTLVRRGPLRLAVDIPEPDVRYLRVGDAARVALDAFPGRELRGKVARRAAALDPGTHTLRVEVEIPNPDGALPPGLYARVRLRLEAPRERLVIPPEALLREGHDEFVFVVEGGRARRRRVVKGLDTGATVEIRAGVGPQDPIVVAGHAGLRDGDPVEAPRAPAGQAP
jgi:membrane fusion protein (multidrug efflux system)